MPKWEQSAGVALVGLAAFNIADLWQKNAPSLSDLRNAAPDDPTATNQLLDATLTTGTLVLVVGVAVRYYTGDWTPLLLMLATFAAVSIWSYQVLIAESFNN